MRKHRNQALCVSKRKKSDCEIKLFKARELLALSVQVGPELSYLNYAQNGGQVNLVLEGFAVPVDQSREALEKAEGYIVFLRELAEEIGAELRKVGARIDELRG